MMYYLSAVGLGVSIVLFLYNLPENLGIPEYLLESRSNRMESKMDYAIGMMEVWMSEDIGHP